MISAQRLPLPNAKEARSRCRPGHQADDWLPRRPRHFVMDEWLHTGGHHLGLTQRPRQRVAATENITVAIERSRRIYELEDNWDESGSSGYKRETWTRAVKFLKLHADKVLARNRPGDPRTNHWPRP